jgi:bacillithiol biosynthesis cysteine-adding enzyme BshC
MAERTRVVVDYAAFQQPPSALFRDYLAGAERAAAFFTGGFELPDLQRAATRTLELGRDRAALATALAEQQRRRGSEQAAGAAERLLDPEAVCAVTGQQAVLYGGPLYVLYKALAVLTVAQRLEAERGAPVVPVFWVASEDHDFAEIRTVSLIDESGQIRSLRYAPAREPAGLPAFQIELDTGIERLSDELQERLPASPHRDAALGLLREAYRPGESVSGAFARFLSHLLPGLVVLDPSDLALKRLMAPVLERELREGSPSSRCGAELAPRLLAAGYHQQVPVRDGFLNLFAVVEGERRALALRDGRVELRGLGRTLPADEALELLRRDPVAWSPGVLLRPLAQDLMLPTAVYVGGPAEIAYHAQIGPSYAHFGVPRPALLPRPSLSLVEAAQARAMESESLDLADLEGDPESLLARWARESYPEVEQAFARARLTLERELESVEKILESLDPTLRAAAEAARGRALHQITTLEQKSVRALKKRDRSRGDRLRRTRDALFPGGALQERGLGLIGPVARLGAGLIDEVRERMDPWARGHQVLYL